MRIGIEDPLWVVEADLRECFKDQFLAPCRLDPVDQPRRLKCLCTDGANRVERMGRVLRYETERLAAKAPEAPFGERKDVVSLEGNSACRLAA